jgi:DNA-binding response OmpR family regulator
MLSFNDFSSALPKMPVLPPNAKSEQAEDLIPQTKNARRVPLVMIYSSDADIRLMFRTALEIWGFAALEAETAENAIELAGRFRPDLVLMDSELILSRSLSSMRIMQNNKAFEKAPFVLLSGHAQKNIRNIALAAGAADFLVKPVNLDVLEVVLNSRLEQIERKPESEEFR